MNPADVIGIRTTGSGVAYTLGGSCGILAKTADTKWKAVGAILRTHRGYSAEASSGAIGTDRTYGEAVDRLWAIQLWRERSKK